MPSAGNDVLAVFPTRNIRSGDTRSAFFFSNRLTGSDGNITCVGAKDRSDGAGPVRMRADSGVVAYSVTLVESGALEAILEPGGSGSCKLCFSRAVLYIL